MRLVLPQPSLQPVSHPVLQLLHSPVEQPPVEQLPESQVSQPLLVLHPNPPHEPMVAQPVADKATPISRPKASPWCVIRNILSPPDERHRCDLFR